MMVSADCWIVALIFVGLLVQGKSQESCTAAHSIDMSKVDSDSVRPITSNRALVIAYQTIPCSGEITRWSAYVRGNFRLSFLVWEQNTSLVYTLVGQNDFEVTSDVNRINLMDFVPLVTNRITVKAGQVVGLYSVVEGTVAGVKAAMVSQTGSQNIIYDFETTSLESVTSIDITSSSISPVPNVRPLISAVIQVPVDSTTQTPFSQASISTSRVFSTFSSLPPVTSIVASSNSNPLTSSPSTSLFSTITSQLNEPTMSTFTQPQLAISSTQVTQLSSSKSPTETEAADDVNLPAMLSVIGAMLVVILLFLTASCLLGAYLIVRNGRRKSLRSDVPIRVLPGLDNGIYMSQTEGDNEYAMVTHQKIHIPESSPSLSHSHGKHITSSAVYHHYESCAASEYLQPVPLSKSLSNDVQPMPSSVSVVYEVPVVIVNRNESEKSSQPLQQSAGYETPIDGKYEEALDTNKDNYRHDNVVSAIYDTPPDATGNFTL